MEVEAFLTEHKAALNDPLADDQHPTIAARRKEGISKAFFEERNSKLKRELKRVLESRRPRVIAPNVEKPGGSPAAPWRWNRITFSLRV